MLHTLCLLCLYKYQFHPYHPGLLHWYLTLKPALQPWWIWMNRTYGSMHSWAFNTIFLKSKGREYVSLCLFKPYKTDMLTGVHLSYSNSICFIDEVISVISWVQDWDKINVMVLNIMAYEVHYKNMHMVVLYFVLPWFSTRCQCSNT